MFGNVFSGKTALITGHTGFKGSWLSAWLDELGCRVVGISNGIPTEPSLFEAAALNEHVDDHRADVTDLDALREIIFETRPDFIFHLAAQAIVSQSFIDPLTTIKTNVMGTANILQIANEISDPCTVILITSDKSYLNQEWLWGYRETDTLGGKDIYSGSKAAAELVISSYAASFLKEKKNIQFGIGRAGNVLGGGDWAKDRIVVDCISNWSKGKSVEIRSPNATRPWQHVLEPLSGYLRMAQLLNEDKMSSGEAFNFGPSSSADITVGEILSDLFEKFDFAGKPDASHVVVNEVPFSEAGLLKLNCDKAAAMLDWKSSLDYEKTIEFVAEWYSAYHNEVVDIASFTRSQIHQYYEQAKNNQASWTL